MKRVLMTIAAVWFAGAVVMSIYYEAALRAGCIKEQGLLKGLFGCDEYPKTAPGYTGMQWGFLARGLAWPYFVVAGSPSDSSARKAGAWEALDGGTPFTVATSISISKDDDVRAILLVHFNPKNSCNPELSLLAVANGRLGEPVAQDKTSTRLRISVGGLVQKEYPSVFTRYTSGLEYAMRLDEILLKEMHVEKVFAVMPSGTPNTWIFPLDGFGLTGDAQREACLKV
ncbi:MAG: hypothetical protein KGL73_01255 [Burkholderiales bacterium]|nr:hypothetical protein [Burkholderiales bacterium]